MIVVGVSDYESILAVVHTSHLLALMRDSAPAGEAPLSARASIARSASRASSLLAYVIPFIGILSVAVLSRTSAPWSCLYCLKRFESLGEFAHKKAAPEGAALVNSLGCQVS